MSKPIKSLMTESYRRRFGELDGAVVVDIRGVKSNDINRMRADLQQNQIRVSVVKNTLAQKAMAGTALQDIGPLLEGPSTLVYGGESVVNIARQLIALAKEMENLEFKGAVMEGQRFGPDQITELSKYPTREEAQAQAVQIILSPGRNLAGQVVGPGRRIASLVKAIEEKLEKGEPIKAAG